MKTGMTTWQGCCRVLLLLWPPFPLFSSLLPVIQPHPNSGPLHLLLPGKLCTCPSCLESSSPRYGHVSLPRFNHFCPSVIPRESHSLTTPFKPNICLLVYYLPLLLQCKLLVIRTLVSLLHFQCLERPGTY